jgi:hypothetical protein
LEKNESTPDSESKGELSEQSEEKSEKNDENNINMEIDDNIKPQR